MIPTKRGSMNNVFQLTENNIEEIRELYAGFCKVAIADYLFEIPPIDFQNFKLNLCENYVSGFFYKENEAAEGFLLYSDSINQAIEITLLYAKNNKNNLNTKKSLLEGFLEFAKSHYPNKIVSYPLLGIQNEFTPDIAHYGFDLIGETIFEFNFYNPISQVVLTKASIPTPMLPYNIDKWQSIYFQDAAKTIHKEFSGQNDVKFDPRFSTEEGTSSVLACITDSDYGEFLPKITTVLKYEHKPIGYCFVNLTTPEIANIPIVVLDKEHQGKGLGAFMLKNSMNLLKNAIANEELSVKLINVTCDTDNFSAIKNYRKTGFKEKTYYTHACLNLS